MSEKTPEKIEEKISIGLNICSEDENVRSNNQNLKIDDLYKQLLKKDLIIEMIKKTIFPALKSKIKSLEEQISLKEQKLETIKLKQELSEIELHSYLPLPI